VRPAGDVGAAAVHLEDGLGCGVRAVVRLDDDLPAGQSAGFGRHGVALADKRLLLLVGARVSDIRHCAVVLQSRRVGIEIDITLDARDAEGPGGGQGDQDQCVREILVADRRECVSLWEQPGVVCEANPWPGAASVVYPSGERAEVSGRVLEVPTQRGQALTLLRGSALS